MVKADLLVSTAKAHRTVIEERKKRIFRGNSVNFFSKQNDKKDQIQETKLADTKVLKTQRDFSNVQQNREGLYTREEGKREEFQKRKRKKKWQWLTHQLHPVVNGGYGTDEVSVRPQVSTLMNQSVKLGDDESVLLPV